MEITLAQVYAQQSEILAVLTEIHKVNTMIAAFALLFVMWIICLSFWKFLRIFF